MSDGLPPIDQSLIPAAVRNAGPASVKTYQTALSFEGMLDEQLAQALTQTLQGSDSSDSSDADGSSPDAATSLTLQLLPQSLSQGLVSAGGIGLAGQLYQALGGTIPTGSAAATNSAAGSATATGSATDPATTTPSATDPSADSSSGAGQ